MGVMGLLVGVASLLPLLTMLGKPWPGFFYSPFYTTNVFTDQTTPAWQAGLRPEDRVIRAGSFGIDQLQIEATRVGNGGKLYLVYELGQVLTGIESKVEELEGWKLLEKAGPLFLGGIMLVGYGMWRFGRRDIWAGIFSWLAGLGLLAAPDYFLGPGRGLESGFDPAYGLGKWASYFYFPIWTLVLAAGWFWAIQRIFAEKKRWWGWAMGVTGLVLAFDLLGYLNAVWRTATYNNPDYVVWHSRGEFWVGWLGLGLILSGHSTLTLALFLLGRENLTPFPLRGEGRGERQLKETHKLDSPFASKERGQKVRFVIIIVVCLLLFVGGYVVPTIFDVVLPGPGPQWYCFGLVGFVTLAVAQGGADFNASRPQSRAKTGKSREQH